MDAFMPLDPETQLEEEKKGNSISNIFNEKKRWNKQGKTMC